MRFPPVSYVRVWFPQVRAVVQRLSKVEGKVGGGDGETKLAKGMPKRVAALETAITQVRALARP
eukprot:247800-Prorocentrum_minimum.AAC.1